MVDRAAPVSNISEQNQPTRAGGRPGYKPTDAQRDLARKMAGEGATKSAIAQALEISRVTLRKHYAAELAEFDTRAAAPPTAELDLAGGERRSVDTVSPAPAPVGRPPFEPNYRQRDDVQLMKVDGWSDDRIARRIGISRNTLLEHFAAELEDGADAIRLLALRNLKLASNKGNVSASNALLLRSGFEPPPPPRDPSEGGTPAAAAPAPVEAPVDETPKGKKEQQRLDALTAEQNTPWHDLMKDDDDVVPPVVN